MASIKVRTEEEINEQNYNYFIALNISTDAKATEIDKAIKEFSHKVLNSSDVRTKRLSELSEDMKNVFADPALKKEEERRALSFRKTNATETVASLTTRGFIYKSELEKIAKNLFIKYDDLLNAVGYLLAPTGEAKIEDDTQGRAKYNAFDKICVALEMFGKSNLYDFYEVSPNAPVKEIQQKNVALNAKYKAQSDAKATAAKGVLLTSNTLKYLTEPKEKQEYDFLMGIKSGIWDELNRFKNSQITTINKEKKLKYINILLQKLSPNDASTELGGLLKYFGIKVTADGQIGICPYCHKPYIDNGEVKGCPACGKSFLTRCWNCGEEINVLGSPICKKCTASIDKQNVFQNAVLELKKLATSQKSEEFLLKFGSFKLQYAPLNKANTQVQKHFFELSEKETILNEAIKTEERIRSKYINDLDNQIKSKKYFAALEIIGKIKSEIPSYDISSYESKVNSIIKEVKRLYQPLSGGVGLTEQRAISVYKEIYAKCIDYFEGNSIIKKFPPNPPILMKSSSSNKGNLLEWSDKSSSVDTAYSIIRKKGSAPTKIDDGELLKEGMTGNSYLDETAKNTIPYYYGVFSKRFGIDSKLAVSECLQRLDDVSIGNVESLPNGLRVQWDKKIVGMAEIIVVRSNDAMPPKDINSGTKINVDENGFSDIGLNATGSYGYLIVCKYVINGKTVYSQGIRETFDYSIKPDYVKGVTYKENEDGSLTITFTPPKHGRFVIKAAQISMPEFKDGQFYPISKLDNLIDITCYNVKENSFTFEVPTKTDVYLYPICIENEEFTTTEAKFIKSKHIQATVEYTIHVNEKKKIVEFIFSSEQDVLIEDISVVAARRRPLSKSDGECIGTIKKVTLKKKLFSKVFSGSAVLEDPRASVTKSYAAFVELGSCITLKRRG